MAFKRFILILTFFLFIQCFNSLKTKYIKSEKTSNRHQISSQSVSIDDEEESDDDNDPDKSVDEDYSDNYDQDDNENVDVTTQMTFVEKNEQFKDNSGSTLETNDPDQNKNDEVEIKRLVGDFKDRFDRMKNIGFKPIPMKSVISSTVESKKILSTTSSATKPKITTRTTIRVKTTTTTTTSPKSTTDSKSSRIGSNSKQKTIKYLLITTTTEPPEEEDQDNITIELAS